MVMPKGRRKSRRDDDDRIESAPILVTELQRRPSTYGGTLKNTSTYRDDSISGSSGDREAEAVESDTDEDDEATHPDGVRAVQAATIVWSRKALLVSYGLIFLIFFTNSLQQQIQSNLVGYVTSDFKRHSLVATTNVVSTLLAGIMKLPISKLIDIFGRAEGFLVCLACAVLGLVMMAACTNVETYAAAQVAYWVGFDGIAYVLNVFIADTSSLKNRALLFAFSTSPYIATTFAGPAMAQSFYEHSKWQWGFGSFAIITPIVCLPFVYVFAHNQREAIRQGVLVPNRVASGRTRWQSLGHYLIEFDAFGVLLLVTGFSLLLLPLSLADSQANQWASNSIITMLSIGFGCLCLFPIHERYLARKTFAPFHLLLDRTILGACLLTATRFASFYCWNAYLISHLQVVFQLSIKDAGYIASIYNIGNCVFSILTGGLIRCSGRFKWMATLAVPLQILGTGLMIYFRQPGTHLGYVIMSQIFIAFSGGTLVVTEELAIMAAAGPDNVAIVLALQAVFMSIGGAVGASISGAIWTNTLPMYLREYLPQDAPVDEIYESLKKQLSYEWESATRQGIVMAYGESQKWMCIAATGMLGLAIGFVMMWRDILVKDFKKPSGSTVL